MVWADHEAFQLGLRSTLENWIKGQTQHACPLGRLLGDQETPSSPHMAMHGEVQEMQCKHQEEIGLDIIFRRMEDVGADDMTQCVDCSLH